MGRGGCSVVVTLFVECFNPHHQFPQLVNIFPSEHLARNVKVKDDLVIPKGTRVLIPIIALHHSKVFWENPEEFRPERCVILHPHHTSATFNFGDFFFQFHS